LPPLTIYRTGALLVRAHPAAAALDGYLSYCASVMQNLDAILVFARLARCAFFPIPVGAPHLIGRSKWLTNSPSERLAGRSVRDIQFVYNSSS
jgi:hypothetical protein